MYVYISPFILGVIKKIHFFLYIPKVLFLRVIIHMLFAGSNLWQIFWRQFQSFHVPDFLGTHRLQSRPRVSSFNAIVNAFRSIFLSLKVKRIELRYRWYNCRVQCTCYESRKKFDLTCSVGHWWPLEKFLHADWIASRLMGAVVQRFRYVINRCIIVTCNFS